MTTHLERFLQEFSEISRENDNQFFANLQKSGNLDRSRLPSAVAQMRDSQDLQEEAEEREVLGAARKLGLDVRGGFRTVSDRLEGRGGGYDGDDIGRLANHLERSGLQVQEILGRASKRLRQKKS